MAAWIRILLVVTIAALTLHTMFNYAGPQTGFSAGDPCNKMLIYNIGLGDDVSTEFGSELSRSDICLYQGGINIQGASANTREFLVFNNRNKSFNAATALTSNDDYSEVVMEAERGSIKLYYTFDNGIDLTKATKQDPVKITFLGKKFNVFNVQANQFSAFSGDSKLLKVGDVIDVNGKQAKLAQVGSNGAIIVEVDGQLEVIQRSGTKEINGVQVTNQESFYDSNNLLNNIAEVVIGEQSLRTIVDGEYYSTSNQQWRWNIGGLTSATSTLTATDTEFSGPFIGIENEIEYSSDSDNPPKTGECINLPENYINICLDGLSSKSYTDVAINIDTVDLTEAGGGASEQAIHFKATNNKLRVSGTRTNEMWITSDNRLYYYSSGIKLGTFDGTNVGKIENLDLKKDGSTYTILSSQANDNVAFAFSGSSLSTITWNERNIKSSNGKLITKHGINVKDINDDELSLSVPESRLFARFKLISTAN